MGVSECEEGNQLLDAAAQPNSGSVAREAFLEHIKHCHLCNPNEKIPRMMQWRSMQDEKQ